MCKIIIIEDDIDICNMITKFLENNKYSRSICFKWYRRNRICANLLFRT